MALAVPSLASSSATTRAIALLAVPRQAPQIGTLVGLLISGDEEALRDWVAAQATNYAVGQVVGSQNAGFVIGFVTDILDENYAGALGLYLGTIACGPPCAAFLEFRIHRRLRRLQGEEGEEEAANQDPRMATRCDRERTSWGRRSRPARR